MRRANDITQTDGFIPAPSVGKHDDPEFGTHHAKDAHYLFRTLDQELDLFSSTVTLNTQYMHSIWFNLQLDRDIARDTVVERLRSNRRVAITDKRHANLIFSFGRDHGYYGRILSQTVVVLPTVMVRRAREIVGFCFTPQDGNSLLSSVAAALWLIDPDTESLQRRIDPIRRWLYTEI
jgi:glyceraldehyde-3-phosphate dehydrogenase (NAD(P))